MLRRMKYLTGSTFTIKVKDQGDKYHVTLYKKNRKVNAAYKSKQDWSNTSLEEVKESLVKDYCIRNNIAY